MNHHITDSGCEYGVKQASPIPSVSARRDEMRRIFAVETPMLEFDAGGALPVVLTPAGCQAGVAARAAGRDRGADRTRALLYGKLEVRDEDEIVRCHADFGDAEVAELARVGGLDGGIFKGLLEGGGDGKAEVAGKGRGHGGADAADVVAGLVFAGDGDIRQQQVAVAVLRGGEDGEVEGVAQADASPEHVEGGAAGEAGMDAEAAGVTAHLRFFQVSEVALVRFVVVEVAAAVLGEDGLRQHAFEGGELDVQLDGLGGRQEQCEGQDGACQQEPF